MHPLARLARATQKKTRLDARRQQELENDIHAVAGLLSETANEQLIAAVRGVERYRDMKALHRALLVAFAGTPHEAAVRSAKPGDICGAWEARSGTILVNGGRDYGPRVGGFYLRPTYFLTHELGEALDDAGQWSTQPQWIDTWRMEILVHPQLDRWARQAGWLRHRAQFSPHEGFCEFLSLAATVYQGRPEALEARFPKCYAFWQENDLLAVRDAPSEVSL